LSSLLGELKKEIKFGVRMLIPLNLVATYRLTRMLEENLNMILKKKKLEAQLIRNSSGD
jgi:hypothetical protein